MKRSHPIVDRVLAGALVLWVPISFIVGYRMSNQVAESPAGVVSNQTLRIVLAAMLFTVPAVGIILMGGLADLLDHGRGRGMPFFRWKFWKTGIWPVLLVGLLVTGCHNYKEGIVQNTYFVACTGPEGNWSGFTCSAKKDKNGIWYMRRAIEIVPDCPNDGRGGCSSTIICPPAERFEDITDVFTDGMCRAEVAAKTCYERTVEERFFFALSRGDKYGPWVPTPCDARFR